MRSASAALARRAARYSATSPARALLARRRAPGRAGRRAPATAARAASRGWPRRRRAPRPGRPRSAGRRAPPAARRARAACGRARAARGERCAGCRSASGRLLEQRRAVEQVLRAGRRQDGAQVGRAARAGRSGGPAARRRRARPRPAPSPRRPPARRGLAAAARPRAAVAAVAARARAPSSSTAAARGLGLRGGQLGRDGVERGSGGPHGVGRVLELAGGLRWTRRAGGSWRLLRRRMPAPSAGRPERGQDEPEQAGGGDAVAAGRRTGKGLPDAGTRQDRTARRAQTRRWRRSVTKLARADSPTPVASRTGAWRSTTSQPTKLVSGNAGRSTRSMKTALTAATSPTAMPAPSRPGQRPLEQERQLDVEVAGADQPHDPGLAAPAEGGDPDGVADQQRGGEQLHQRDDDGGGLEAGEHLEELLEQLLLVLHVLDAGPAADGARDDLELRRVLELDPEGLRQRVGA